MATTPNLDLPLMEADQAQKHVTHNEALMLLDALVHYAVQSRSLTEPPTSPEAEEGQAWIVAYPAEGDWEGQENNIAVLQDGEWRFIEPQIGLVRLVLDEGDNGIFTAWDGFAWGAFPIDIDAATLDTVLGNESSTWTPTLTFATPGDLSVAYSTRIGRYVKKGKLIFAYFNIVTSAFTHSTASGSMRITGAPGTVDTTLSGSMIEWRGITKANFTQMGVQNTSGNITIVASGSGQVSALLAPADMPSGGSVILEGQAVYLVT